MILGIIGAMSEDLEILLNDMELESINGGWSPQGFAISFVLGGAVGVGAYSIYQFGMDQGYRNNKK